MGNERAHVGVEVGDGLVARFGDCVVLIAEPGKHPEGTEQLLQVVELAASSAGSPGGLVAQRLATVVAGGATGAVPSFAVVAPVGDTYVVLLHGSASAEVSGPSGVERYSGEQAVTWLDRKLGAPFERLSVGRGGRPVQVDPRSDLRAGLVPGSGFVLTPVAAPGLAGPGAPEPEPAVAGAAAAAEPEPEAPAPEPEDAVPEPAASEPEPAAPAPAASGPGPAADRALVAEPAQLAITLAGPEATEPSPAAAAPTDAGPLAATGRDLQAAGETAEPYGPARATQAAVVPVGQLVASDGMRIPLDRAYVLGREPENDPAVRSGAATPVRLTDQDNLISRVHSYVTVEGGQVSLSDASSANGTYLAAPGDQAWTRVGTDPVVLPPTWSIRLGNQVFTYVATAASS